MGRHGGWAQPTGHLLPALPVTSTTRTNPFSLADDLVTFHSGGQRGRLWIGTANGLDQLDRVRTGFVHFRHDEADAGA